MLDAGCCRWPRALLQSAGSVARGVEEHRPRRYACVVQAVGGSGGGAVGQINALAGGGGGGNKLINQVRAA